MEKHSTSRISVAGTKHANAQSLPLAGLLALATTGFIAILTETLPAGLLPQIGAGLHVSTSLAGQLVTSYAAGSLVAAIPLTAATQTWSRRRVLLSAVAALLLFNALTAIASQIVFALAARFLAGVAAGLIWGVVAGYARRMLTPSQQGRGMAVAMIGTPLALSLGLPAGTLLGNAIGWRAVFLSLCALTGALVAWIFLKVPNFAGQPEGDRLAVLDVFRTPGICTICSVVFLWMTAHNVLYTYIAPYLAAAGRGTHVDGALLLFGLASLAGIGGVSLHIDRRLRELVLLSLGVFLLAAVALLLAGKNAAVLLSSIGLWGLSFGGAATLLQTASAEAAGDGVDIAQAIMATTWNCAIAAGGMLGGLLIEWRSVHVLPAALVWMIVPAFLIAYVARSHGFPANRAAPSV